MKYTLEYIIKIAEHKFGKKDRKSIEKYIKEFDPDKPEFLEDEKSYNLNYVAEKEKLFENEYRYRILQDIRYLRQVYGRDFYTPTWGGLNSDEAKKKAKEDPFCLQTVLTTEPFEADDNIHYHRYSVFIQRKFGFHHDHDTVLKVLKTMYQSENANERYKSYFKMLFTITCFEAIKRGDVDVMELFSDYESLMTDILKTEIEPLPENNIDVNKVVHGGMEGKELIDYLNEHIEMVKTQEKTLFFEGVNRESRVDGEDFIDNDFAEVDEENLIDNGHREADEENYVENNYTKLTDESIDNGRNSFHVEEIIPQRKK